MNVNLTQKIQALIDEASQLRSGKVRNKVIARLEEAHLWSKELPQSPAEEIAESCICPIGAEDSACPVHGNTINKTS